jgi:hypothetical protein
MLSCHSWYKRTVPQRQSRIAASHMLDSFILSGLFCTLGPPCCATDSTTNSPAATLSFFAALQAAQHPACASFSSGLLESRDCTRRSVASVEVWYKQSAASVRFRMASPPCLTPWAIRSGSSSVVGLVVPNRAGMNLFLSRGGMRYFLYAIYCSVQNHVYSYFLQRCIHCQTAIMCNVSNREKRTL